MAVTEGSKVDGGMKMEGRAKFWAGVTAGLFDWAVAATLWQLSVTHSTVLGIR